MCSSKCQQPMMGGWSSLLRATPMQGSAIPISIRRSMPWKKRNINSAPSPEKGQNEKLGGKFRCNILQRSSSLAMPLAMSSPATQVGTMP